MGQKWVEYVREQMQHFKDRRKWAAEWGYALLIALEDEEKKVAGLEEALAEYENDETPRRREDAYAIRQLQEMIDAQAEAITDGQKRYAEMVLKMQDKIQLLDLAIEGLERNLSTWDNR